MCMVIDLEQFHLIVVGVISPEKVYYSRGMAIPYL